MPFRIRITLFALAGIVAAVLILPLVWPLAPLEGTVPVDELRSEDATLVRVDDDLSLHVLVRNVEPGVAKAGAAPTWPPSFVLVHGFGSNLRSFGPLLRELPEAVPAVAYDRPGFGLTDRPLGGWTSNPYGPEAQVEHVLAVMDEVGLERAVIVGNSVGGDIALRVALERPERVEGLVLLSPTVYRSGGASPASRPLLFTPQLERLGPAFMRRLGGESGESFLRAAYADPDRVPDEVLAAAREATSVDGWDRALWEVAQAPGGPDLEARLADVAVPVLVLAGDADAVVPPELGRRLAGELPHARFEELDDCGHRPQEECPSAVAGAIADWADEVAPAR